MALSLLENCTGTIGSFVQSWRCPAATMETPRAGGHRQRHSADWSLSDLEQRWATEFSARARKYTDTPYDIVHLWTYLHSKSVRFCTIEQPRKMQNTEKVCRLDWISCFQVIGKGSLSELRRFVSEQMYTAWCAYIAQHDFTGFVARWERVFRTFVF